MAPAARQVVLVSDRLASVRKAKLAKQDEEESKVVVKLPRNADPLGVAPVKYRWRASRPTQRRVTQPLTTSKAQSKDTGTTNDPQNPKNSSEPAPRYSLPLLREDVAAEEGG
jgi:hypothetical protein